MRYFWLCLLCIVLMIASTASPGAERTYQYYGKITNIVDADTMDVTFDLGLGLSMDVRVRIHDYDAPETWRPSSIAEALHGAEATAFATQLLEQSEEFVFTSYDWAVYNRVEVDIHLPDGQNFADVMIANDFSKRETY